MAVWDKITVHSSEILFLVEFVRRLSLHAPCNGIMNCIKRLPSQLDIASALEARNLTTNNLQEIGFGANEGCMRLGHVALVQLTLNRLFRAEEDSRGYCPNVGRQAAEKPPDIVCLRPPRPALEINALRASPSAPLADERTHASL